MIRVVLPDGYCLFDELQKKHRKAIVDTAIEVLELAKQFRDMIDSISKP